ncbi:MAG: PspC domain-containing protein [Gammaproteobacteria bacterium]|nr:PspC domain-containing protein [Gammaproteobacteria bacterium]
MPRKYSHLDADRAASDHAQHNGASTNGPTTHGRPRRGARARQGFYTRRNAGWGFNLYRNTRDGKIGGVCAGVADYWEVEAWVVRLLWVGLFIFASPLAFWLYVGAWIALAPRPHRGSYGAGDGGDHNSAYEGYAVDTEYDEIRHQHRPRKMFRYSDQPAVRLARARERLDAALRRTEDMESYVTSRRYSLNKEFSQL